MGGGGGGGGGGEFCSGLTQSVQNSLFRTRLIIKIMNRKPIQQFSKSERPIHLNQ